MALLNVKNLSVTFQTQYGPFKAVDRVTLQIDQGSILGIVGESGSGKSVTMLAVMGLLPKNAIVTADEMTLGDRDLLKMTPRQRRQILGRDMAMIFQEPMTSLNPSFTIGFQLVETLRVHEKLSKTQAWDKAVDLLKQVGLSSPEARLKAFPHQLSGGMCQRVMIAMALACNPKLLIADEPTTALDVTIQAQILDLLRALQREHNMALILITHDMGVVAEMADRIVVMYAGQVMEERKSADLFIQPYHPYTEALLAALPERSHGQARLATLPGVVPGIFDRPPGCLFQPRCRYARENCLQPISLDEYGDAKVRCIYPLIDKTQEKPT